MEVIAHRGLGSGFPGNTHAALQASLKRGYGVEFDVRQGPGKSVVISHDAPGGRSWDFSRVAPLLRRARHPVAVHLKEDVPGVWEPVCRLLDGLDAVFLFDMHLEVAAGIRRRYPQIRIGFSVAQRPYLSTLYRLEDVIERPECDVIVWDEWDRFGSVYRREVASEIHRRRKTIMAISPELHAATSPRHEDADSPERVWESLTRWNVDYLCTDYPRRLKAFIARAV